MKLLVDRKWKKDTYTIGKLYIDGIPFCETLEDKDRGLNSTMSLKEVKSKKIYGETAIPAGTYELVLSYSSKFSLRAWSKKYKGLVPELLNVKGFSGIRIHPLNTAKDSLGCIGVGRNTVIGMITDSTTHYYKLMDNYIVPAINKKEKITIIIK